MTATKTDLPNAIPSRAVEWSVWTSGWTLGSVLLALLALMPVAAVLFFALDSSGDIWTHLVETVLFGYLSNTLLLMLGLSLIHI